MDRTSPTLLQRLRDGSDQMAWHEFLSRYWRPLYAFARSQGLDAHVAEEVVQDVTVAIFERRGIFQYDPQKGRFSNYLFRIVAQQVALRRRLQGRRRELPQLDEGQTLEQNAADTTGAAGQFERIFEQGLLVSMLDVVRREVNPATYQAFELITLHNVAPDEAARITGLTRNAVYQAKKRIMARLQELGASYARSGDLHESLRTAAAEEPPERTEESLTESLGRRLAATTEEMNDGRDYAG